MSRLGDVKLGTQFIFRGLACNGKFGGGSNLVIWTFHKYYSPVRVTSQFVTGLAHLVPTHPQCSAFL